MTGSVPNIHVNIADYGSGPSVHYVADADAVGITLLLYRVEDGVENPPVIWSKYGLNGPGTQFPLDIGSGEYRAEARLGGHQVSDTFTYRPNVPTEAGLYNGGDDGSAGSQNASGDDCTVYGYHSYSWDTEGIPHNNSPKENSLYPWDRVRGTYTWDSDGCCKVRVSGPTPDSRWSLVENRDRATGGRGTSYDQVMDIVHGNLVPGASADGIHVHTAEYDESGRTRTHFQGVAEGHGLVAGTTYTIKGYTYSDPPDPSCSVVSAKLVMRSDFRYRTPFWETSIHEHHILDADGYPASNLDYSQYRNDAIPLEAGSNLILGGYRDGTIKISHKVTRGGTPVSDFHCNDSKTCSIELLAADAVAESYVGHKTYEGDAKNPPWDNPDGGVSGELDRGEAMFVIPARTSGEIRIESTMTNNGAEVAKGYNVTYQFVYPYNPVFNVTAVSNTALGGDTALDRPVSVIVSYNGTLSTPPRDADPGAPTKTLHYCTVGDAYDADGSVLPYGENGVADAWERVAGDYCPETEETEWGVGSCNSHGCSYKAHPEKPASTGWGRWSAVNPETRAMLHGFTGEHRVECPPGSGYRDTPVDRYLDGGWERDDGEDGDVLTKDGEESLQVTAVPGGDVVREYTECHNVSEAAYTTPYLNWDFVPGTERDFIPACVADAIAAKGDRMADEYGTNKPKPADWGENGDWADGKYAIGDGAEPHSYRGVFAAGPLTAPTHYVVNSGLCENELGYRECVPRGSECRPEYDRRCESVFEPFLYPDDYIMAGHERLQEIVVGWCGPSPSDGCALDAYDVIDEVMVSMCKKWGVEYEGHNQVIDAKTTIGVKSSPNACHNMISSGLYGPVVGGDGVAGDVVVDGNVVDDWRECYGAVPEATEPPSVWPDGKPDAEPHCVMGYYGDDLLSLPNWDGKPRNVYVPYTPSTGAFGGVVERPGNMLLDDGSLTCGCPDDDGDSICDYTETEHLEQYLPEDLVEYLPDGALKGLSDAVRNGPSEDLVGHVSGHMDAVKKNLDLDGNGIIDKWDPLTPDGAMKCLDRTGTAASAAMSCWAKHGLDAAQGDSVDLKACLNFHSTAPDGPDGECDPAIIVGSILPDGEGVSVEDLPFGWNDVDNIDEVDSIDELRKKLSVPLSSVELTLSDRDNSGGSDTITLIPIPYVVDGEHPYCDPEKDPWCMSSGDTYLEPEKLQVCESDDQMLSVKRIPAPATMPPLYQPVFDEQWPPRCLPEYPVAAWERPEHDTSLDTVPTDGEWPTRTPGGGAERTPAHVGIGDTTMLLHSGEGVIRFGPAEGCGPEGCEPSLTGRGMWTGSISSNMGNSRHDVAIEMDHAPFILDQEGTARVVAVEPCDDCENGWRHMESDPGIQLVATAYPVMENPATRASEMVAHECQIDGDRGTGLLNAASPAASSWSEMMSWATPGLGILDAVVTLFMDLWNGMTCRDIPGISITIQDYEAARGGVAAKRESGQPWNVTEGKNDITVQVFRNGLWISTLSILEHRGQCTSYAWSPAVTPGHTSCPNTAEMVSRCISETGDIGACMEAGTPDGNCAAVFVEDGIHKKWEFNEKEEGSEVVSHKSSIVSYENDEAVYEKGVVEMSQDLGRSAAYAVDTVYRMPDGSYADSIPETVSGDTGDGTEDEEAAAAYEAYMKTLEWAPGGGDALLRCEVAVAEDGMEYGLVRGLAAEDVDLLQGGSYACEDVQACQKTVKTYKCLGGEVVENVTCEDPDETFSILDMPYEEVMANTAIQNIHVEAVCPDKAYPETTRCNGLPIYDTHVFDDVTNHMTIYVDYFGVGEMQVGRGDSRSRTVVLTVPETFGNVHAIWAGQDDDKRAVDIDRPCKVCVVEHPGEGLITVANVYGGELSVEVEARSFIDAVTDTEDLWGALWLYLPLTLAIAAVYMVIRRFHKQIDIWDGLRG